MALSIWNDAVAICAFQKDNSCKLMGVCLKSNNSAANAGKIEKKQELVKEDIINTSRS